ncbi:ABC transporter ATP-binding protein [Aggregatilinea lenta]|uniref:ABC transporter ATP-binding protein n=1 Tax=Aggregatilinea lenta TaxID=913108 RepID=UPI001EE8FCEF|nr:ABC transporter ATP-binding protein [Aggregatilinea lenta]
MDEDNIIVETRDLTKDLQMGQVTIRALRGVTLQVRRGEVLSIIGPSGSGKSTLLGLIGGLDTPTGGRVLIDGRDITDLSERELTRIRNEKIGFVFQFFNLLPTLTAEENVALPIQVARKRPARPAQRARELLAMLELDDRLHHRPSQLSGGQQQRVAIARALANNPPLVMCDEPTGNLDTISGALVMQALHDVNVQMGTTIIIVTHDMDVASQAHRVVALVDGQIADEYDPRSSAQRAGLEVLRRERVMSSEGAVR